MRNTLWDTLGTGAGLVFIRVGNVEMITMGRVAS